VQKSISHPRRYLFIVPHQDDETIFFGNSISDAAAKGAEVHVACLTGGEAANLQKVENGKIVVKSGQTIKLKHNLPQEDLKHQRQMEFEQACKNLGVKYTHTLDLPDGGLSAQHVTDVSALIQAVQPVKVFTFDPTGASVHADHQACFYLSLCALIGDKHTTTLYFVQKPRKYITVMDEWSYTIARETFKRSVRGVPQAIRAAADCYKTQSALMNYFLSIDFFFAPEFHTKVSLKWHDFSKRIRFSEQRVEDLYFRELPQYYELAQNIA
jgi:LmbE family N-acetylglucosaminyl deacetylase